MRLFKKDRCLPITNLVQYVRRMRKWHSDDGTAQQKNCFPHFLKIKWKTSNNSIGHGYLCTPFYIQLYQNDTASKNLELQKVESTYIVEVFVAMNMFRFFYVIIPLVLYIFVLKRRIQYSKVFVIVATVVLTAYCSKYNKLN